MSLQRICLAVLVREPTESLSGSTSQRVSLQRMCLAVLVRELTENM